MSQVYCSNGSMEHFDIYTPDWQGRKKSSLLLFSISEISLTAPDHNNKNIYKVKMHWSQIIHVAHLATMISIYIILLSHHHSWLSSMRRESIPQGNSGWRSETELSSWSSHWAAQQKKTMVAATLSSSLKRILSPSSKPGADPLPSQTTNAC